MQDSDASDIFGGFVSTVSFMAFDHFFNKHFTVKKTMENDYAAMIRERFINFSFSSFLCQACQSRVKQRRKRMKKSMNIKPSFNFMSIITKIFHLGILSAVAVFFGRRLKRSRSPIHPDGISLFAVIHQKSIQKFMEHHKNALVKQIQFRSLTYEIFLQTMLSF